MKKLLNQKEQHYADTREEAEEIVENAKTDKHLTMHKITGKTNKFGPYFLTDLTYTYSTPREIMEEDEAVAPDGQLTIEEVEQQEEEINLDDIQFEDPDAPKAKVDEGMLPF